jgi:hypothetical protein
MNTLVGKRLRYPYDGMMGIGLMRASDDLVIYTTSVTPTTFDPSWVGGSITVDWGDGTPTESHATGLSHTYAMAGTKKVKFSCSDWSKITTLDVNTDDCIYALPSFSKLIGLSAFYLRINHFTGIFPSLSSCIHLSDIHIALNNFSGVLPSFSSCVDLLAFRFYSNIFSGKIPSFISNTKLLALSGHSNLFNDYEIGGFSSQKSLASLELQNNLLPETSINAILTDLVESLSISGRVPCTVNLAGTGNAPPSYTGIENINTLSGNGWTVTVNKENNNIVYLGGSVTDGYDATDYDTMSWRGIVGSTLQTTYSPGRNIVNYNAGIGGTGSWYALIRLQEDVLSKSPSLITCDWTLNDSGVWAFYQSCQEACLRRILTACPTAQIAILLFITIGDPDVDNTTNLGATQCTVISALAAHYGLTVINCVTPIQNAVTGGTHLNALYNNSVHPVDAGHIILANTILPVAITLLNDYPVSRGVLPLRLYASAELENTPIIRYGIDNDGETGSGWSTSGNARISSTGNDTISWDGTFQSFGMDSNYGAGAGSYAWSVDGGAETIIDASTLYYYGPFHHRWAGVYGVHTVTVRIVSGTVEVKRFMAI